MTCPCRHVLHPDVEIIGLQYPDVPGKTAIAWNCLYGSTHNTPVADAPKWMRDRAEEIESEKLLERLRMSGL